MKGLNGIKGQIRKAMSGFYYVLSNGKLYQTRGRGQFRLKKQIPLVGDFVEFESTNEKEGVVTALLPRQNELVRPPICNVDYAVIVMSAVEPDFSTQLLDRFIVSLEQLAIQPILYVSKMDLLADDTELRKITQYYQCIGYDVIFSNDNHYLDSLKEYLKDGLSVLMGQSGAGKSTLLNQLLPNLNLKTAKISDYLGRGKHTTRHVEIHEVEHCLIADTPGFSSIDFFDMEVNDLKHYFVDFEALAKDCKFRGCLHIDEPDCAVKVRLDNSQGLSDRHTHYLQFYNEVNSRKKIYSKRK